MPLKPSIMATEQAPTRAHICEPDAARLIQCIGKPPNDIRILTFWSLEGAYPAGKLRYHLGQLGMLRLMNDLADHGCQVDALICDSQSRAIVGGSAGDLEADIQTTDSFIRKLKNRPVKVRRMSQLVDELHRTESISHHVARRVVNGALSFRNFIQQHPPADAVISGLGRFRSCVQLPDLDSPTAAYLDKLKEAFSSVEKLDLLAALYASDRRPKWFDAFWLGDIAAWVAEQAKNPNTIILEADRSAYSWLTHRCFLAIGAIEEGGQAQVFPWPSMYFAAPVLSIDGNAPMQLSVRPQAIFLHHTHEGIKDRLARASSGSLASYSSWLKPPSVKNDDGDVALRAVLLSHIESQLQKGKIQELLAHPKAEGSRTSALPDNFGIGLCLSGGGFRAVFFHLGIVKLLRDLRLLKKVVSVYSVSGGSILAANLAQHWQEYVKDEEDATFFEAIRPLLDLARADIRGRIVRRLFWFGSRADRLAHYYESILGLKTTELKDLPGKVEFTFLGTSMKTGTHVAFKKTGVYSEERQVGDVNMLLSRAVAASSAFPPLFEPLRLSKTDLGPSYAEIGGVVPVTDGGVYDNLGLTRLLADSTPPSDHRPCIVALVSDASAPFKISGETKFHGILDGAVRATDIMMKRVGDLESAGQSEVVKDDDGVIKIFPIKVNIEKKVEADLLHHFPLGDTYFVQDNRVQDLTSLIRTDLDVFTDMELAALMRRGYEVGLDSLREAGMAPRDFRPRDPCGVPFPQMNIFNTNQSRVSALDENTAVNLIRKHLESSSVRGLGRVNTRLCRIAVVLVIALVVWLLFVLFR